MTSVVLILVVVDDGLVLEKYKFVEAYDFRS